MPAYKEPKVDALIEKKSEWAKELKALRKILRASKMTETWKWSFPTYTHLGKNIASISCTKKAVGIWFFQGALLKDKKKKLRNAQEGKTKAMRQWLFKDLAAVKKDSDLLAAYLIEAKANQEAGKEIKPVRGKKVVPIPAELKAGLKAKKLTKAFAALSQSKQNEYNEHIASAKQEATKQRRLDKILPMILVGKGLHDKYKK